MTQEQELAWAAGFWDGEGCTSFFMRRSGPKRRRYRALLMQIYQSEQSTLERFRDAVGIGRFNGPYLAASKANC